MQTRTSDILSWNLESIQLLSNSIDFMLGEMDTQEIINLSLTLFKFNASQCGPIRKDNPKTAALIQLDKDIIHSIGKNNTVLRDHIVRERKKIFHGGKLPEHKPTLCPPRPTPYPTPSGRTYYSFMRPDNNLQTTDDMPEIMPVTRNRAKTF